MPDSAIDLIDEACANVRVARETSPEAIDTLERRKLQLQVEIHALSVCQLIRSDCPCSVLICIHLQRERDDNSRERLKIAQKDVATIDDQLAPLRAAYELENQRGKEIANVRRRIDELRAKADEAERRYDLATASDLRYYAIPDLQKSLAIYSKRRLKRKMLRRVA